MVAHYPHENCDVDAVILDMKCYACVGYGHLAMNCPHGKGGGKGGKGGKGKGGEDRGQRIDERVADDEGRSKGKEGKGRVDRGKNGRGYANDKPPTGVGSDTGKCHKRF